MAAEFEMYKDSKGEYRWKLQAGNNKVVADCAEGFSSKEHCKENINVVRQLASTVPVHDTAG